MKSWRKYGLAGVIVGIVGLPLLWQATYNDIYEARNLHYQCWKLGVCELDPDRAVATLSSDGDRDDLILGKTLAELQDRYGFLTPRDEDAPYHKMCTEFETDKGDARFFLRHSDWMVTMKNGRAPRVAIVKGC